MAGLLLDPTAVIRMLEKGFPSHIPLDSLTDHACRSAMRAPPAEAELHAIVDGKLKSTALGFDGSRELLLSKEAWREAWRRYIRMIATHCSLPNKQALADAWKAHFERIEDHPQFSLNFKELLDYDIRCRLTHLQQAFDPSQWQTEIWREVIEAKMFNATQSYRQPSPRAYSSLQTPIRYQNHEQNYRSRPYNSSYSNNQLTYRQFPPSTDSRPRRRSASPPPARQMTPCVVCGQRGHRTIDCRPSQSFLIKVGQTWLLPDKKQVCYSWNSSESGCRGQCYRIHVCSLCGGKHPMLDCTSRRP